MVGENGAGKSTLVKILYGFSRADAGEIRFDGRPVAIRRPQDARGLGIGMVFQELVQVPGPQRRREHRAVPARTCRAVLGRARAGAAHRGRLRSGTASASIRRRPLWRLSVGERQRVEIVKLLLAEARVLILDEPTRGLAPHEVESLLAIFTTLRRDGYAVVFITHKLRRGPRGRRPHHGDAPGRGRRLAAPAPRRPRPRWSR